MPLATLGAFIFELKTAPYDQLQRSTTQRWASNPRVGRRAAQQHIGPGDDHITLSGTLMPELTGGPAQLDALRAMQASGRDWILLDGSGRIWGQWIIQSIDETRSEFFADGTARQIEFSLKLQRSDDDGDALGPLRLSAPFLFR